MGTYLIAELGSTHDGSLGNCLKLIEHCARAGADAVKLQDHRHERIKGSPPWVTGTDVVESRAAYLQRTSFDTHGWRLIRATATVCGVDLVVSPFSAAAVALLEQVPVDAYKIASGQVTNMAMLRAIGATKRRVFVSSGMTTGEELSAAIGELGDCVPMHCTSEYPCAPQHVGLNILARMRAEYPGAGFSDHTMGVAASLAAVTMGAKVIERHVAFHRGMYGTDARHSLTVEEFGVFVHEVRSLDRMLESPVDKSNQVQTPEIQAMRAAFLEREST